MNCRRRLLLCSLLAAVCGCPPRQQPPPDAGPQSHTPVDGGGVTDGGPKAFPWPDGGATYADYCAVFNRAACIQAVRCGFADPGLDCDALVAFTYNCSDPEDAFAFDPVAAQACLATLDGVTCNGATYLTVVGNLAFESPCNRVLLGTRAEGQSCNGSAECLRPPDGGSLYCYSDAGEACAGVCASGVPLGAPCAGQNCLEGFCKGNTTCVPYVAEGGDCSVDPCDYNVDFCNEQTVPPRCQPHLALGQPCPQDGTCELWLNCIVGPRGGTCEAPPGLGLPCAAEVDHPCAAGLECTQPSGIATVGTCVAPVDAYGLPCDANHICTVGICSPTTSVCEAGGTNGDHCDAQRPCTYIAGCDGGTCVVPGALGESCADTVGSFYQCRIGLYCNGQVCAQRRGPGEACTPTPFEPAGTMCMDGFCDPTGHCSAYLPVGAACVPLPPSFTGLVSVCGPVPQWCDGYPDGGGICIAHCF